MPSNSTKSAELLSFASLPCHFSHALVVFSLSSVFMFRRASPVHHYYAFCSYVWVMYLIYTLHPSGHVAVLSSLHHILSCLSFANRAFESDDLYINFNWNHLIFPAAYLVCQVDALFIFSLPEHAYASHITSRISWHVLHHVACALHRDLLWFLCLCSCFG